MLQLEGRINNWILGVKGLINISYDELEKIEINKLFNFSLPYLYNINQISIEKKNINLGIISWSNTKFSELILQELYGYSKENCTFYLGIKGLTEHDRAPLSAPIKKTKKWELEHKDWPTLYLLQTVISLSLQSKIDTQLNGF